MKAPLDRSARGARVSLKWLVCNLLFFFPFHLNCESNKRDPEMFSARMEKKVLSCALTRYTRTIFPAFFSTDECVEKNERLFTPLKCVVLLNTAVTRER